MIGGETSESPFSNSIAIIYEREQCNFARDQVGESPMVSCISWTSYPLLPSSRLFVFSHLIGRTTLCNGTIAFYGGALPRPGSRVFWTSTTLSIHRYWTRSRFCTAVIEQLKLFWQQPSRRFLVMHACTVHLEQTNASMDFTPTILIMQANPFSQSSSLPGTVADCGLDCLIPFYCRNNVLSWLADYLDFPNAPCDPGS